MPLRFNVACCCLKPRLPATFLPSLRSLQSSSVLRGNYPQQRCGADQARTFAAMAPKQATLGYVRSSQTTLGCGDALNYRLSVGDAMLTAIQQKVLWEAKRRGSQAAIETSLFYEAEAREERCDSKRGVRTLP